MHKSIFNLMIIIVASIILVIISTTLLISNMINEEINDVKEKYADRIVLLSDILSSRIDNAIAILESTRNLPAVKNIVYVSDIRDDLKGIPETSDIEKRQLAKDILNSFQDFVGIRFVMPNGDSYIGEPYSQQLQFKQLNFNWIDWYNGVVNTKKTYVGSVYRSVSLEQNVVGIATPVYSDDGTFVGIWGGLLSPAFLSYTLSSISNEKNAYVAFFDNGGKEIIHSDKNDDEHIQFSDTIIKALAGESGIDIKDTDGKKFLVAYAPVIAGESTWAVILVQPYDDAFYQANSLMMSGFWIVAWSIIILSATGYVIQRYLRANVSLAEKLLHAERQKDEFSAMVTHELRTPLVTISGYLEMLKEPGTLGTLNKDQTEAIDAIYDNAKKLDGLISDILTAQKTDLKSMKFNNENFRVDEFMAGVVKNYVHVMKDKKINFINSTNEQFSINSDKERLNQVLGNLIKNSIDFVSENGRIEINATSKNGESVFYVKDNGIGIPKEKQSNLFKKFYQIDTSFKRKHGGTGLGLVICKGMVEGLGGRIWLESEEGKGTTVYFSLPNKGATKQNG